MVNEEFFLFWMETTITKAVTGCVILANSKINRTALGLTWKDKLI